MGKPSTDTEGDTEALVMGEGLQKLDIKRSSVLSANELVGTGFGFSVPAQTQRGILKAHKVGLRPLHPLLTPLSLTSNRVTTNLLS